jgi:DNA repair exonuclease SbcCD nuclease subunit
MGQPESTYAKLARRKSAQTAADPSTKTKGRSFFQPPDLKQWKLLWSLSERSNQVAAYYGISVETLANFRAREAKKQEETGIPSVWLEGQKEASFNKKKMISNAFLEKVNTGDTQAILFGMKSYCGAMEQYDEDSLQIKVEQLKIQKENFNLKTNQFLAHLAEKFQLDKSELEQYAKEYFKKIGEVQSFDRF